MEMLADDVAELLIALEAPHADVVGLSMGGYVALALWELRPHMVRSLGLIDTRAVGDGPEARSDRDAMAARILDSGRSELATDMVTALLGRAPSHRAQARLRSMVEGTRYETLVAALAGMRDRNDRSSLLGGISVPSVIISGEDDGLIPPEEARALAAAIPGARTTIVPDAGHLPAIEQPDAVNEALIELFEGRKVVWWK